jgi:hypothetical protein
MWRKTERANLEKKPSTRLSQDVLGREGEPEAVGRVASPARCASAKCPSIVQYPDRSSPIRPHTAILPSHQSSSSQWQTRNPPTDCQFHSGRFHGIGRLVDLGRLRSAWARTARTQQLELRSSGSAVSIEEVQVRAADSGG